MTPFSVIITHFKREKNLRNTLKGLSLQTKSPLEVVVVEMGDGLVLEDVYPFKLNIIDFAQQWDLMPLAAARNLGAKNCNTEQFIFLDVDCIPAATFCEKMLIASTSKESLVMGSPRYLLTNENIKIDDKTLVDRSVLHPSRPKINGLKKEDCYELFWSLCFAIPKKKFETVGGFDEKYEGYGGEDTDFALEVRNARIDFYLSEAEVYHQQHPVYIPPLNHLEAIQRNSNTFYTKWNYWPMTDCLSEFAALGYINWQKKSKDLIKVIDRPTEQQVQKRLILNAPYR